MLFVECLELIVLTKVPIVGKGIIPYLCIGDTCI